MADFDPIKYKNMVKSFQDRDKINSFVNSCGLKEISFLAYDDKQEPSVPHFFAVYKK